MKSLVIIFLLTTIFFSSNGQMCGIVDSSNSSQRYLKSKLDINNLYFNNMSCTFLIHPPCADSIFLNFINFRTEYMHDSISIYDGTSINDPLILSHSGLTIPPSVIATSGSIFMVWSSDSTNTDSGFVATWTTKNNYLKPCNCYPSGLINCCGIGISRLIINQIGSLTNSLNVSSGTDYYSDFSCLDSIIFYPNSDYFFLLNTTNYLQQVKIWIDFDNNGVFDSLNEVILDTTFTFSLSFIKNFDSLSIPFNGQSVRMRISTDMPAGMDPCTNLLFGEVEDYSVSFSLTFPSDIYERERNQYLPIYPNPAVDYLCVDVNSIESTKYEIDVYNSLGTLVTSNTFYKADSNSKINLDVSDLTNGVYRLVVIQNNNVLNAQFIKISN